MSESCAEMRDRFPDRVIQKRATPADAAMQLGRDVTGLLFHPVGVVFPGGEQTIDVFRRDSKDVDQHRGRHLGAELLLDRHAFVERAQTEHDFSPYSALLLSM